MKITKRHINNILMKIITPYAKRKLNKEMNNLVFSDDDIDFSRKDAFVILGNHLFEFDALAYGLAWKRFPKALVSRSLMITPMQKFQYRFLTDSIPKSQGENDIKAVKDMIKAIKEGNSLLILPEGEISYFGATQGIDKSIAKLLKKLNVEVITAVSKGGYISRPRWAMNKRDSRYAEIHFSTLITKEEIESLTHEDIYERICSRLKHNDFDWQRENMILVGGDSRAEGLEKYLFICPECNKVHSIKSQGNDIVCTSCKTVGNIDEYGFIKGFKFDNTVDWNNYQLKFIDELKKTTFTTKGTLYDVDYNNLTSKLVGDVVIKYDSGKLYVDGVRNNIFEVKKMQFVRVTQRNVLTFDYEKKHYYYKMNDYFEAIKQVCKLEG